MNELEIRRFIDIIHPDNKLFEVRIIDGKRTFSGYFTDSEKAYNAIQAYAHLNIYIVFNAINEACYSRVQKDKIMPTPVTTSDVDITSRQWILIDIDPKRPSACNSTDDELKEALSISSRIGKYLRGIGFSDPVFGMSGNGYHMLYKVNIPNTPETAQLVKEFLQSLSLLFGNDIADIDTSVFNSARITKLLGTVSRKGTDKDDLRPQRLSRLLHIPKIISKNDISLLRKVVEVLPKQEKPTYHNNYGRDRFDIDSFIRINGIRVQKESVSAGVRKIVLEECPFNNSHKAPDSALFIMANGAVGFKCLHNSCSHHSWRDVRLLYDPSAYDKITDYNRTTAPIVSKTNEYDSKAEKKGAKFLQLKDIKHQDRSKIVSIPTGVLSLDKRIIGLNKGETSLISGSSGSGKSTLVNQMALNAINKGFKVSIWSGELTASRMKSWIHLQAAGRQYSTQSTYSSNSYYVKHLYGEKIDLWLSDKLHIYNNDYGNKFLQLMSDMYEHVKSSDIDLVVFDNLMAMDILMLDGDKMQQQNKMIIDLTNAAKELNIHIALIAHPRKVVGFLRKNDIAGNADLANAVDNVFIVHRVNNDFVKSAAEFYGSTEATKFYTYNNVVEVCKNRDLGIQDELFGLYFEVESKRFLNEKFENIVYPWVDMLEEKKIEFNDFYRGFEVRSHAQVENDFYNDRIESDYPF